ncbi:MAG: response regulator [Rubrivivax sp.]
MAERGARLLVADDNKVNRLLLARGLELQGHQVTTVADGREALARLNAEAFDLLLLDLEMPEMDGFALLEALRADERLREVPVIVTSSLEGVAQVVRCIELGADDYLHKPVNPTLLKARVDFEPGEEAPARRAPAPRRATSPAAPWRRTWNAAASRSAAGA